MSTDPLPASRIQPHLSGPHRVPRSPTFLPFDCIDLNHIFNFRLSEIYPGLCHLSGYQRKTQESRRLTNKARPLTYSPSWRLERSQPISTRLSTLVRTPDWAHRYVECRPLTSSQTASDVRMKLSPKKFLARAADGALPELG